MTTPKIEHCGNSVYAVHITDGVAIYPTLDDALEAIRNDEVVIAHGDAEYYDARDWMPVKMTLADLVSEMPVDGPTGLEIGDNAADYEVTSYLKTSDGFRAIAVGHSGDTNLVVDDVTGCRIYRDTLETI